MPPPVTRLLVIVLLGLTLLSGCTKGDASKNSATTIKLGSSTTSTTALKAPPVTALGSPDSYALPASWPTDPATADPSQADLSYVQHVIDAFDAIVGLANKEVIATGTVSDQAKLYIAEYSYNEEMVGIEIDYWQNELDTVKGRMLEGQNHAVVDRVLSISPRCFVAEVTRFPGDVLRNERPFKSYLWMGIPPESRGTGISPSPWRLAGYGSRMESPENRCGLEID